MPKYKITANVEADVVLTVQAPTEAAARALVDGNAMVTFSLSDVDPDLFEVQEDTISGLDLTDCDYEGPDPLTRAQETAVRQLVAAFRAADLNLTEAEAQSRAEELVREIGLVDH